jgi:hypothetical protein
MEYAASPVNDWAIARLSHAQIRAFQLTGERIDK